ncbi:hypothetical protein SEA_PHORGEOUS_91 [Microbacterium phage Phorgeous]|nr:hypothetical protein SEA_PHORGEOUS_91 [Microbacterium phage Phorgeous]
MSNVTRKQVREFLEAMDNLAEPDAAARLQQAQMLSACAVPDDLVQVIARIGARGRVMREDLNIIADRGYTLPPRREPALSRGEVIDSLIRGATDSKPGDPGVISLHVDNLAFLIGRAYDLGMGTNRG